MAGKFKEADMFPPLKAFFEDKGYRVNGEVNHCDLTAVSPEELVIVEIKRSFTITLLYQAIDRQRLSDLVFVAIPRMSGKRYKEFEKIKHIAGKLDIGLITVAMDSPLRTVEIAVFPEAGGTRKNYSRRARLLKELSGRSMDLNAGGSTKVKLMTAFREKCIRIACVLELETAFTAAQMVKGYGFEKDTNGILYRNTYGWFQRLEKGVYALSPKGKKELELPQYEKMVAYYRDYYSNFDNKNNVSPEKL